MDRGHRQTRAVVALGIVLACCACAFALDPSLDINQYAHTAWKIREGFSKGAIYSIAQTPDGYLWLGTEFGLLRFDGVRNIPWDRPGGEHLPSSYIRSLLAAHDGRLWIGTYKGLASWKDGKLTEYRELAGQTVDVLLQDREGTVWAGGYAGSIGRLCAIQSGSAECYGDDGRLGLWVASLYEDSRGNLWAGAQTGLWQWKPGPPKLYPMPDSLIGTSSQTLNESDDGSLLIATQAGIKKVVDGKAEAYSLPGGGPSRYKPLRMFRDRNGSLWIGTTDGGLLHVHQGRTDVFTQSDGLSGDYINKFFEDREGNVWVATVNGLDRFRDFAVPTISLRQGLSTAVVWSVLGARDGSVWLGTPDGLNRWNNGQITIYRKRAASGGSGGTQQEREPKVREVADGGLPDDGVESLFEDDRGRIWAFRERGAAYFENGRFIPVTTNPAPVEQGHPRQPHDTAVFTLVAPSGQLHSIAGDSSGNLWISDQHQGLFHLLGGDVVERIPWATLGRKYWAMALLAGPVPGGLWLGFSRGGVAYFKDGKVSESYSGVDGLGEGIVNSLSLDSDGTLWAATEGGLSRVKNGRVATLTSQNGLPCDTVFWEMQDDGHDFWLYTACGLVRIAGTEMNAWVTDPKRTIQNTVFDSSDGVRNRALTTGYTPLVAKTVDGKLWFLPLDGVSVIDPRHLPFNKLPPPVHIEQVTADRKTYWQNWSGDASSSHPRLPPLVRDLTIDYTALSFVAPEKVLFRYKLEGMDRDWQDAGNRRQAFYTNLSPGNYRFRVAACNNSGIWNEAGTFLDFSIAPAYYQTNWFLALCAAGFLALLWGIYRLRIQQLQHQFAIGLEARVNERTRIARDLHDTLLQSFHGLMLRFQAATNLLPERPVEAKQRFESAIDQAAQAVTEGRDAVQGLRSSTVETNDLAMAISALGEELAADGTIADSALFRMAVEGTPRNLHPILRDEVYRIAGETLRNAFRHAQARQIEVEIHYDAQQFRLRVRDDGKGIDPEILGEDSRPGHFGLHGMRERAKLVGGQLDVWSELDSGTEVELSIPASRAYATSSARRSWWSGKGSEIKS